MGGVDLKDQMVQPYLLERKRAKKWYVKFFKRAVNAAVHNAFMVYKSRNKTHHLTYHLDLLKALILTHRPQVTSHVGPGRPSINPPPERLFRRNFIEEIPATRKNLKPQRHCAFCSLQKTTKESIYWCPDCKVGLCVEPCFKVFQMQADL